MTTPACPECEKLHEVAPYSQKIGEFLEWIASEHGAVFAEYHRHNNCYDREGFLDCGLRQDDLVRFSLNKERLLAEFFGIDLEKVEQERRALLESLRSGQ